MEQKVDIIFKYFPDLSENQKVQFSKLYDLYFEWNNQINVISRKDFENMYEKHVLHSLAIAKYIKFKPGTKVLDVGTGGGFPGIPLAIMFPETKFHLVDSIGKKIKVVKDVAEQLGLKNVKAEHTRAESVKGKYHFVVSRAVTRLEPFMEWIKGKFLPEQINDKKNGVLYLKGGDLDDELLGIKNHHDVAYIPSYFKEEFFETKKVVHVVCKS